MGKSDPKQEEKVLTERMAKNYKRGRRAAAGLKLIKYHAEGALQMVVPALVNFNELPEDIDAEVEKFVQVMLSLTAEMNGAAIALGEKAYGKRMAQANRDSILDIPAGFQKVLSMTPENMDDAIKEGEEEMSKRQGPMVQIITPSQFAKLLNRGHKGGGKP